MSDVVLEEEDLEEAIVCPLVQAVWYIVWNSHNGIRMEYNGLPRNCLFRLVGSSFQ